VTLRFTMFAPSAVPRAGTKKLDLSNPNQLGVRYETA